MTAFVACSGGEKKAETDSASSVEKTTTKTKSSSENSGSSDIVAQYEKLCDKLVELAPKMKAGDTKAIQEYQKIAQKFNNFSQENADAWSKLSEADAKKIQEIAQKATKAMQ